MMKNNPNPAFGSDLEPFHGITTFMRLPASRDFDGVDVAIVGIPFDGGTSYRSGTRFGPRRIRESSLMIWGYNRVLNVSPTDELKIVDFGDISVIPVDIRSTMDNITTEVQNIIKEEVKVVALGGDHSISLPLLRAHAAKYGKLAVVHFDSHPDTWNEEYDDQPYSHGTPYRRAIEEKLINWKDSKYRKPLIVRGARQIGKTFSIKKFGDENFENTVLKSLQYEDLKTRSVDLVKN